MTQQQVTKLYVNGQFVSNATGEFNHNGTTKKSGITNATFALPLQRIGSETNAVQATIDNVNVTAADMYNKSKWTGTTNSETTYNNVEGLLRYAFDNDYTSRWHSNWKGATDKLTGSNSSMQRSTLVRNTRSTSFHLLLEQIQPVDMSQKQTFTLKQTILMNGHLSHRIRPLQQMQLRRHSLLMHRKFSM